MFQDKDSWNSMALSNSYLTGTLIYFNDSQQKKIYFYFVGENNDRKSKPAAGTLFVDFSKFVDKLTSVSGSLKWVVSGDGTYDKVGAAGLDVLNANIIFREQPYGDGPGGLIYTEGKGYSSGVPGVDAGSFCVATYNKWIA